jgi:hypothetical protein
MQEGRDCVNDVCAAVRDGLRQIGDFSYAIMPKDVAHAVGDLKRSLLTQMRDCLEWEMLWIKDRVEGGDRMREEWREKCRQQPRTDTTSSPGV